MLVGKLEWTGPLGKYEHRLEDNIKMGLKETVCVEFTECI